MELAMLDRVVAAAQSAGVQTIYGYYLPTPKNGMVADHYEKIGFVLRSRDMGSGVSTWSLDVADYEARNRHINILELSHG
jgi:predicted enzyme involved in methoxymalonyl-ACP biosynthesis